LGNYKYLGNRRATGQLDTTGNNTGNWTVTFDPATVNLPPGGIFEVQKITIRNGTPGVKFDVYIDANHYTRTSLDAFGENEWAPTTDGEFVYRSGEYLYYYMQDPFTSGNAPLVVMYFKMNTDDKNNQLLIAAGAA
jgi:hypothetical protein